MKLRGSNARTTIFQFNIGGTLPNIDLGICILYLEWFWEYIYGYNYIFFMVTVLQFSWPCCFSTFLILVCSSAIYGVVAFDLGRIFIISFCCYKIWLEEWLPVFIYLYRGWIPGDVFLVFDIYPSKNGPSCSHLLQVEVDIIVVEFPPSREVGKYDLQVQNFNSYILSHQLLLSEVSLNTIDCIYQVVTAFSLHGFLCCILLILFWMIVASWFTCSFIMRVVIYLTKRVCY